MYRAAETAAKPIAARVAAPAFAAQAAALIADRIRAPPRVSVSAGLSVSVWRRLFSVPARPPPPQRLPAAPDSPSSIRVERPAAHPVCRGETRRGARPAISFLNPE